MESPALVICGLLAIAQAQKPSFFIINGNNVKLGEIPYQVSPQKSYLPRNRHYCGGTILNERWIVTAAHCLEKLEPEQVNVVVGTVSLKEPYMTYQTKTIVLHKDYDEHDSLVNDIALLKVATPIKFSDRVQPAVLPEPHGKVETNSPAVVSGWGYTDDNDFIKPDILQKATVFITNQTVCRDIHEKLHWVYQYQIKPTHICANDPTKRRGVCKGDSGGPLIVDGVLTGIASWSYDGDDCASPHYPSVYTRVPEYVEWIRSRAKLTDNSSEESKQ